jgi:hypothetical protein
MGPSKIVKGTPEPALLSNGVKAKMKEEPLIEASPPTRSQRKRNPPKWTENMVMDYEISHAVRNLSE